MVRLIGACVFTYLLLQEIVHMDMDIPIIPHPTACV